MNSIENKIKDITNNYYKYLMNIENVNGVGYSYKFINGINTFKPCLKVFVDKKINRKYLSKNNIIPNIYMGIESDVDELGEIYKNTDINTREYQKIAYRKIRPLQGGCFIGVSLNYEGKVGGCICCIVKKEITVILQSSKILKPKKEIKTVYYILSNAHVIAEYKAFSIPIGTSIFQPAPVVAGDDFNNEIALLDTYIPVKTLSNNTGIQSINLVDCAIARLKNPNLISNKVLEIGSITGVRKPELWMKVKKVGAISGLTRGEITALYVTKSFNSAGGKKFFKDLVVSDLVAQAGDSGCPMLTADNEIVGMHLGGTSKESFYNDINIVLKELNVEVYLG